MPPVTGIDPDTESLQHLRGELAGYCYRMLGSPFEAEDAVQETMVRAWRGLDGFEGRAVLRTWVYRIATNVCIDMLRSSQRRARPMDLGPAGEPVAENLHVPPEVTWLEPLPDPADAAIERGTVRLAFVAALQHLSPRQRAVLILRDVLDWRAREVADLLETSVPAVDSALRRARATVGAVDRSAVAPTAVDPALLDRYVAAFEAYDIEALTDLLHEDVVQSMPPYDLWLRGRDDVFAWWLGPGIACRGSRLLPTAGANGSPAFGQYKPDPAGGWAPWSLQVLEVAGGRITEVTSFLETERLFPLFGLPSAPSR